MDTISKTVQEKRKKLRDNINIQPVVSGGGHLDTSQGLCFTTT